MQKLHESSGSSEEEFESMISEIELPCKFAKLVLNCGLSPGKDQQESKQQAFGQHLDYAERHKRAGKTFTYSLFDTAEPGGISIDESNSLDLQILSSRHQRGHYFNIVYITMQDQEADALHNTLKGVIRSTPRMQHTLVVIIFDCLYNILDNPILIKALTRLRLFALSEIIQYKIRKEERLLADKCYAFESKLAIKDNEVVFVEEDEDGTDVLMTIKHEKMKKLHSLLWAFFGFAIKFEPRYVIIINAGTEPKGKALNRMVDYMETYENTGAASADIQVKDSNFLQCAQWCEYKLSSVLLSTFESMCGYLSTIDPALSIYRWQVFLEDDFKVLKSMFSIFEDPDKTGWISLNLHYLAESRLCSEQIVKLNSYADKCCGNGVYVRFIKQAKGIVQGQPHFDSFVAERRVLFNGAIFSLLTRLYGMCGLCNSSHNACRSIFMVFQLLIYLSLIFLRWFSVSIYFVMFSLAFRIHLWDSFHSIEAMRAVFVFLDFSIFSFSLAISIKYLNSKIFWVYAVIYAITFAFIIGSFVRYILMDGIGTEVLMIAGILMIPNFAVFLYGEDLLKWLKNIWAFLVILPIYLNLVPIFSVNKTDDVSNPADLKYAKINAASNAKFKQYKIFYVLFYVLSNTVFGILVEQCIVRNYLNMISVLAGSVFLLLLILFFGEILFLFKNLCVSLRLLFTKTKRQTAVVDLNLKTPEVLTDRPLEFQQVLNK